MGYGSELTGGEGLIETGTPQGLGLAQPTNSLLDAAVGIANILPFTKPIAPILNAVVGSAKSEYNKAITQRIPFNLSAPQKANILSQIEKTILVGETPMDITLQRLAAVEVYGTGAR